MQNSKYMRGGSQPRCRRKAAGWRAFPTLKKVLWVL